MPDLAHDWGSDLSAGPSGDLALADGALLAQQRVLRRLLTNPGDYIWQPEYGAGLGRFVGQPDVAAQAATVIRAQLLQEAAIARNPPPLISIQPGPAGTLYARISFNLADTGQTQLLSFSVGD